MIYHYAIRHLTRFTYSAPVTQSQTEVRMQPRTEGPQRCHSFRIETTPRAQLFSYRDHDGNVVHHFDVPEPLQQLSILAEATVEMQAAVALPEALPTSAWQELTAMVGTDEYVDLLQPTALTQPSALLEQLLAELDLDQHADPLTLLRALTAAIYDRFAYVTSSTHVDSPIDHALELRQGVCQDFTHIMLAIMRLRGIPGRYVSGYLIHTGADHDRSTPDATHAWVEALLPDLGWVGFDPTNNVAVAERHIRVAVGRDYADVPPTRGVHQGMADGLLEVAVQARLISTPARPDDLVPTVSWSGPSRPLAAQWDYEQQQ